MLQLVRHLLRPSPGSSLLKVTVNIQSTSKKWHYIQGQARVAPEFSTMPVDSIGAVRYGEIRVNDRPITRIRDMLRATEKPFA